MKENCGYCHGVRLVGWSGTGPILCPECSRGMDAFHAVTEAWREQRIARLSAEKERDDARSALEESEHQMHMRVRSGYDRTVADSWRAKVAEIERERDELRARLSHAEADAEQAVFHTIRERDEAMKDAHVLHGSLKDYYNNCTCRRAEMDEVNREAYWAMRQHEGRVYRG